MPDSDDLPAGALKRLDERMGEFEASRHAQPPRLGVGNAADGYRLLGQMLGGVLGGLGLGWAVDHFAHTSPWGIIGGLVVGATLSVWATVRSALRMSAKSPPGGSEAASPGDD